MACILTSGYTLGCRDNTGGVKRVFITAYDSSATYTLDTDGQITAMTQTPAPDFFKFDQDQEVASFEQTVNASIENGTVFYEQTLMITLLKQTKENLNHLKTLAAGAWRVLILDQNGTYLLMGKENAIRVSAGNAGTGKALGDLNGMVITFTGKEPAPATIVTAATAATLLA